MKRTAYFIVALVCFFANIANAQTIKQKVAVYVTGEAESGYKKVIGSKLVSSITDSESFVAIERTADFLSALSQEQDYQTSGAVSDNQIVRLGQQFGVRYVLVADVSEVFGSMFIAARMIDVQTGQITNATESSLVVNSMEGLTELSENVIAGLIDGAVRGRGNGINVNDVKIIGPFSNSNIYTFQKQIPAGYRAASKTEIDALIASYRKARKVMAFPIYAGISIELMNSSNYTLDYYITATFYESEDTAAIELNNVNYYSFNVSNNNEWTKTSIKSGYIYLVKQ